MYRVLGNDGDKRNEMDVFFASRLIILMATHLKDNNLIISQGRGVD